MLHGQDLIGIDVGEHILRAIRPIDRHGIDEGCRPNQLGGRDGTCRRVLDIVGHQSSNRSAVLFQRRDIGKLQRRYTQPFVDLVNNKVGRTWHERESVLACKAFPP